LSRQRSCAACGAAIALAPRPTPNGHELSCGACGQVYVGVESRFLFGAMAAVVFFAAIREWIPAALAVPVVFAIGTFGTTYYAVDPARRIPPRWHHSDRDPPA
jgi:ribosomal protein S27AE